MKFIFAGVGIIDKTPIEQGKLAQVYTTPETNSRACRKIFVLVAKEIDDVISGEHYSLGLVGKDKKIPMIFPIKPHQIDDSRILVMGDIPSPKHRADGYINDGLSDGNIIDQSSGGGAWGSGTCFLAVLKVGQKIVSNRWGVWENEGGSLKERKFDNQAEFDLFYNPEALDVVFI